MMPVRTNCSHRSLIATCFRSLSVLLCWCLPAPAVGIPAFDLNRLIDDSNVILVGRIGLSQEVESKPMELRGTLTTVHVFEAEVTADNVLKGRTTGNVTVRYLIPDVPLGYRGLKADSYRVIFLRYNSTHLELTSPYYPSLPAAKPAPPGGNPFDSVVAAVAATLQSVASSEPDRAEAAFRLRNVRTDAVTAALKTAVTDSSLQVQAIALSGLLARGDTSVLPAAVAVIASRNTPQDVRRNIASGIYEGVRSTEAVPLLATLLVVPDDQVREAAAMALRRCHCSEAIPSLIKTLDNPNRKARYLAVVALAEFTGENDWRPLEADFKADEQKYLRFWKEWGTTRR